MRRRTLQRALTYTLAVAACMMEAHGGAAQACDRQSHRGQSQEVRIEPVFSYPVAHTPAAPDRLVLTGTKPERGTFKPTGANIPSLAETTEEGKAPFPIGINLLRRLDFRVFGIEERAQVTRDGAGVIVTCTPGQKPAGAAFFSRGLRFPRGMLGDLVIEGQADAAFSFATVMSGEDAPVGQSVDPTSGVLALIPSSYWNDADPGREIVATCPKEGGSASVSVIRIDPAVRKTAPIVGTWIWRPARWFEEPDTLVSTLRGKGVSDVYLQVPLERGKIVEAGKLRLLLEALRAGGLTAHAVEGDPDMVTPAGRRHALERARVLRRLFGTARLRSAQYDIEPYLRPEFSVDPAEGWREWAVTIRELAATLDDKIEIVVPFWMLDDQYGAAAIAKVRDTVSAVVVMAYRTNEGEIERIAENWLSWGAEAGVEVRLALENGPLPIEAHRTFVRAERGEVVLDRSVLPHRVLLFDDNVSDSYTMPSYSFSHEVAVPPSRVTFAGDSAALATARERLGRILVGWPSFGGLLIHELVAGG